MDEYLNTLRVMLTHCAYIEDVKALKHFVFHPRYNGCSNVCLFCQVGAGDWESPENDPLWALGHEPDCPYAQAVERVKRVGGETLAEYTARQ